MPNRKLHLKCRECGRILPAALESGPSPMREHSREHPGLQVTYQFVVVDPAELEARESDDRELLHRQ